MKKILCDTSFGILVFVVNAAIAWVGYWCLTAVPQATGWLSVGLAATAFAALAILLFFCWGIGLSTDAAVARVTQEDKHAAEAIQGDEDEP
jgi:hypothetical protein